MMVGLLGVTTSWANKKDTALENDKLFSRYYRYAEPIQFMERGVTFFVYSNGEFDFNRKRGYAHYGRRGYNHRTHPRAGKRFQYKNRFGQIQRDYYGNIVRVGRTYIDYDRFGRVTRIGSVDVDYGRRGNLRQVGNMFVTYNREGRLLYAEGEVKSGYCGICGTDNCSITHFSDYDHKFDHWDNDGYRYKKRKRNRRYHDDD